MIIMFYTIQIKYTTITQIRKTLAYTHTYTNSQRRHCIRKQTNKQTKNSVKINSNDVQNKTLNITKTKNHHLTVCGRVAIEEDEDRNEQRKERTSEAKIGNGSQKKRDKQIKQTNRKTKQISMYHLNNSS